MGGFGSGRHGGTVTAEGTESYVIAASMLIRGGRGVTGVARFDEGRFWVAIRGDISDPADPFIELTHPTRDEREGDRIVRDRIRLVSTVRTTLVVSMPEDRTQNDKAVPTQWGMAFPEPPGLPPRICLPARGARGSLPSKGSEAEPPARRRRIGCLRDASGEAEMDAVANL
jgi:hypothetical protein